jgi:hypothetical protein
MHVASMVGKDHLGDLGVDGKGILKWNVDTVYAVMVRAEFSSVKVGGSDRVFVNTVVNPKAGTS